MESMQIVVFVMEKDEYGIEISYVQEIVRVPEQIVRIPDTPAYIEGLVNLRGKVIPVLDFRKRFGFEERERNVDNRLLILNFDNSLMGIIVDDVSEVINIQRQQIENVSSEIKGAGSSIEGICKLDNRLILMLDAARMRSDLVDKII